MSQSATARWRLRDAPGGLALVQEFLNTRPIETKGPDLLADTDSARAWMRYAVEQWAHQRRSDAVPVDQPTDEDLRALRGLRSTVEAAVGAPESGAMTTPPVPALVTPQPDGTVDLAPTGIGWQWLASALWIEIFRAQQDGTWPKLKLCRNPVCASAFYDTSRNNSGAWHDVRTCGNIANLRASRERKRADRTTAIG